MNLFAIVGCQRCGTTLLGMMLGSHPLITYFDEDGPYPVAVYRRRQFGHTRPVTGLKLTTLTPEAARFKREMPTMRFLFLTRGILSTCASMLKMKWVDPLLLGEELQMSIDNLYPSAYQQWVIRKFLKYDYGSNAHKLAALYAQVRFNYLYEYDALGLACTHVPYERLVANPQAIARRIAEFLGIEYDDRILNHAKFNAHRYIHGTAGHRAIDIDSVCAYRETLEKAKQIEIMDVANEAHEQAIGYYASFKEDMALRRPAESLEEHIAKLKDFEFDPSALGRDPFQLVEVAANLSEREKVMVERFHQGASYEEIAGSLHTDSESVKLEMAALLHKNDRLLSQLKEQRSLSHIIRRAHLTA
jgi:hypothetical protein